MINNIAAYKFVEIADTEVLQAHLKSVCAQLELKGTILLANEGINLFLAGQSDAIAEFLSTLRADARFRDIEVKLSQSESVPFRKMLVKIKPEIITMKIPTIRPAEQRAPAISAQLLKKWLDQGYDDQGLPVVLLDTRNRFEIEEGTFQGAIEFGVDKFSEFPDAVKAHQNDLKGKRVVTFCTGGIRCEKAAIFMQNAGIQNVTQLDGGILKYFEEVGQDHYSGECFVFDDRYNLDSDLKQTDRIRNPN